MNSTQQTTTVQTYLRPDFHEWFPVFTRDEMRERLATMPFELATLLRPRNVRLAVQIDSAWRYLRYLRLAPAVRQVLLAEVLRARSIPSEIADVVAKERHRFARQHHQAVAYMDRSLPVVGQTYLSAPGLVAFMLSMSQGLPVNTVVCEIGVGTGLHALCLARLMPNAFILGVDRSTKALSIAAGHVERDGLGNRFRLLGDGDTDWAIAGAGFVYATAALSLAQLARLTRFGKVGSTWLVPRQLTREEFESEPSDSWLWRSFGSYAGYCAGGWNQFVAVERFTLRAGGHRRQEAVVYDVRFVRYTD